MQNIAFNKMARVLDSIILIMLNPIGIDTSSLEFIPFRDSVFPFLKGVKKPHIKIRSTLILFGKNRKNR